MDIIVEKCKISKILSFNGAMHLKHKLRICTIKIKLEKIGFLNFFCIKIWFLQMLKGLQIIFSYKKGRSFILNCIQSKIDSFMLTLFQTGSEW